MSCIPLADLGVLSKVKFSELVDSSKQRISQIVINVEQVASKTYEVVAENGTKVALAIGTSIMTLAPNSANAAGLVVDSATGVISGTMDMSAFYSGAAVAAVAIGATIAVFLGIGALKKAK